LKAKTRDNRTPLQIALDEDSTVMIEMLKEQARKKK
jgi:hypothetical protein